jgi:hypothetical protein
MDNVLQTALAEAVNSLASFFGTTTEAVMTHAPEFLVKYGWYNTLNNLGECALIAFVIMIIIGLFTIPFVFEFDVDIKHPILKFAGGFIICFVFLAGMKIVTCAVAPEIVGAHAILELLKNMG